MNTKNACFVSIAILILIIFISGCTNSVEEPPTGSSEDQIIISVLMDKLNAQTADYKASYKTEHQGQYWAGGSGASGLDENSEIHIELSGGNVIDYTINTKFEGYPLSPQEIQERNYSEYYDKAQMKLCRETVITESPCNQLALNPPKLGGILTGCKISFYPDGKGSCECATGLKPIEDLPGFACSEEKNTDNFELQYGHAIYYPETKKGFCYYESRDKATEKFWAFECDQNNTELIPQVTNNTQELSNVKCYHYGSSSCTCTFDPAKTLVCSEEKPKNFDAETKQEIKNYLAKETIASISEKDNEFGHCYVFQHNGLEQVFCFDDQNKISFAQWGNNIQEERRTHIDIYKIEKYQQTEEQKESCGGWTTGGTVICSCDGRYEKPSCPEGAICDSAVYFCYGACGKCKCYMGPEDPKNEVPCGDEKYFYGNKIGP